MIAKAVKGGFSDLDDSGNTNASSSKSTDTKVSSSDLVDNDGAGEYSGGEKSAASEIHKAVSFIDKSSEEIGKRVVKDAIKTGVSESNK